MKVMKISEWMAKTEWPKWAGWTKSKWAGEIWRAWRVWVSLAWTGFTLDGIVGSGWYLARWGRVGWAVAITASLIWFLYLCSYWLMIRDGGGRGGRGRDRTVYGARHLRGKRDS